jgi:hypothetical protein
MKENKQKYIKHIWSILCQSSVTDALTNTMSLFNAVEQFTVTITPPKDPTELKKFEEDSKKIFAVQTSLEIVTLWQKLVEKKNIDGDVEVELVDPKGAVLMKTNYSLHFPEDKKRMRYRMAITAIKVTVSGEYTFKIKLREPEQTAFVEVVDIPLDVIINKASS